MSARKPAQGPNAGRERVDPRRLRRHRHRADGESFREAAVLGSMPWPSPSSYASGIIQPTVVSVGIFGNHRDVDRSLKGSAIVGAPDAPQPWLSRPDQEYDGHSEDY